LTNKERIRTFKRQKRIPVVIRETRNEYGKTILKEVREMSCEVLPQVVKIIHLLKEGCAFCEMCHKKREAEGSGHCGIWKDECSAAEII